MTEKIPAVYIVDDDPAVLKGLKRLLVASGLEVLAFESAEEFLDQFEPGAAGCIVLDLAMPGFNGLDLQRALGERGNILPIVFLTGRGDVTASVRAMKNGAVDFLTKPVDDEVLLAAIGSAVARGRALQQAHDELTQIEERLATLSPREREVLERVVAGRLNKQIAAELGIVEKTIKVHRANVMRKMVASSLADLVRLAERAGIRSAQS